MLTQKYCINDTTFWVRSTNSAFLKLVQKNWGNFSLRAKASKAKIIFELTDSEDKEFKHRCIFFNNGNCLILMGPSQQTVGYFYEQPWQVYIEVPKHQKAEFTYFFTFEPLLLTILKRLNIFVWHSAAVTKNGKAVLLAGASGSGKTTTALSLIRNGYQILSDDTVFLAKNGTGAFVLGREKNLFVTSKTISFFPELKILKSTPNYKKGDLWKKKLSVNRLYSKSNALKTKVKLVLFPKITRNEKTTLKRLEPQQVIFQCLRQKPKEHPASVKDGISLEQQFKLYSTIAESAKCYSLNLGKNVSEIYPMVNKLLS